jgi:hypothetical protein
MQRAFLNTRVITMILSVVLWGNQLSAQTRTATVCWAENEAYCPAPFGGVQVTVFPCGSGGHGGFNPNFVCRNICGVDIGFHCKITAGPSGSGGRCGFRQAQIECFN